MDTTLTSRPSIAEAITWACRWEAAARKAGNVHPGASFDDLSYSDLVASAEAIGLAIEGSLSEPLGQAILRAVRASRQATRSNAHLGTILLLAPLARASSVGTIAGSIAGVLDSLTVDDTRLTYAAIRLAAPGGLGRCQVGDVGDEPSITLGQAMHLAADRDLIARQYATCFRDVVDSALPWLTEMLATGMPFEAAVVRLHLRILACWPDSLIARKCGSALAGEISRRATEVLRAGGPETDSFRQSFQCFDSWLRCDGNRRNPGASADLVAATLFVTLREKPSLLPVARRICSSTRFGV
jgi:triphosphoribosyl-dephospho-CoA synthase